MEDYKTLGYCVDCRKVTPFKSRNFRCPQHYIEWRTKLEQHCYNIVGTGSYDSSSFDQFSQSYGEFDYFDEMSDEAIAPLIGSK